MLVSEVYIQPFSWRAYRIRSFCELLVVDHDVFNLRYIIYVSAKSQQG